MFLMSCLIPGHVNQYCLDQWVRGSTAGGVKFGLLSIGEHYNGVLKSSTIVVKEINRDYIG